MDKTMLIDAICGVGLGGDYGARMVSVGLADFTGDQHEERYAWSRTALERRLDVSQLIDLYLKLRESRGDALVILSQS